VPSESRANDALYQLRAVALQIQSYPKIARKVDDLHELVEAYMTKLSPGFRAGPGDTEEIALICDRAHDLISELMAATRWAVDQN
jgi:hypothetical protein